MGIKLHGIDPESDQFYTIARDYSICPEVETIAKIHKLSIQKIMGLLDDGDFTDLVTKFRKQSSEKNKDSFRQYVDSKKFYFIKKLEELAENDEHPKQIDAIKHYMTIAGEIGKGSSPSANKSKDSGNGVKIEVFKDTRENEFFDEDEEDEYEDEE